MNLPAAATAVVPTRKLLLGATLGIVYGYVSLVLVPHKRMRP